MKNVFGPDVRNLVLAYSNLASMPEEALSSKILCCALCGFKPHTKAAKEAALWWETTTSDDLEEGLINLMYWTYEWLPYDGFRWACAFYYALGLQNFIQQHNLKLTDEVKDAYDDLQKVVAMGAHCASNGQTFQRTMYAWDRQARKMGSLKHVRHYRRRQCSPKR